MTNSANFLAQYEVEEPRYREIAVTVSNLLSQILKDEGVQVHSVTSRCKSAESLAQKISKPDKSYDSLSDITDLAGVRVITYFSSDVQRVASIIEREFAIDRENSIDKRELLESDRFGYQSLHYVFSLSTRRLRLPEYKKYDRLKLEIQVRSILQHAWAEIEHDLGYKTESGIPKEIRRRFARIAGLLEVSDVEFDAIRQSLVEYEQKVPEQIAQSPESVEIDLASLRAVFATSRVLIELDTFIAGLLGAKVSPPATSNLERLIPRLEFVGVKSIGELESIASTEGPAIRAFAAEWVENQYKEVPAGISVIYICYLTLGRRQDPELVMRFLDNMKLGLPASRPETAARVLKIASAVDAQLKTKPRKITRAKAKVSRN